MIVIDTSAIVALFKGEPEAEEIARCIDGADAAALSASNLLEASMVLSGIRWTLEDGNDWLDRLLREQDITIEPVTAELAQLARIGFRIYGKGSGHGAALNFGDCFAYALARSLDAPLLFKGDDFAKTDVRPALA